MIGHLLDMLDACLALLLADRGRIAIWGLVAGAGSMWIYAAASPQKRLKALAEETAELRRSLDGYQGEFGGAMPLIRRMLATALHRLALVLWPSLLAGLPVIALVVWIDDRYGFQPPRGGEPVRVEVIPPTTAVIWQPADAASGSAEAGWMVRWPKPGANVRLMSSSGTAVAAIDDSAAQELRRRTWLDLIVASRAATLPANSPIESVQFGFAPREVVSFGPTWARSCLAMFIAVTCVASLAVKFLFRIA